MNHVGDAGHLDFDGNGDLLLYFFGGTPGPLGDDLDIIVGDVGVGFDREIAEGNDAPGEEQNGSAENEPAIVESKVDEPAYHRYCTMFCSSRALVTTC